MWVWTMTNPRSSMIKLQSGMTDHQSHILIDTAPRRYTARFTLVTNTTSKNLEASEAYNDDVQRM